MSENPDDNNEDQDDIDELLKNLRNLNSDIVGSALFGRNGKLIRTAFSQKVDKALIGEISSIIQSNAEKSVEELSLGLFQRVLIEGERGTVILSNAGKNVIMCVIAKPDARLGMVFLNIQSLTKRIGSKKINHDDINKAVDKILSTMREKETSVLTLERKYLPELLAHEMLRFDTKDELPIVNYWATMEFGFREIRIKYDDELVIFEKC